MGLIYPALPMISEHVHLPLIESALIRHFLN
jgi:hypothetical protein